MFLLVLAITSLFLLWLPPPHPVAVHAAHWLPASNAGAVPFLNKNALQKSLNTLQLRGGDVSTVGQDTDEERYSRQVFAVGARAHGLIRSATVYLDGPMVSGLLYECAKNLALSGIRQIVLIRSHRDVDDIQNMDDMYHDDQLDDLGKASVRGALAEINGQLNDDDITKYPKDELLKEYIRRLNPSVTVSIIDRSTLQNQANNLHGPAVLLSVDRPLSTQIQLNQISRQQQWSFVSVETAGVFGKVFCDFGDSFIVHDADGETPLSTPLDRLELQEQQRATAATNEEEESKKQIIVYSIDGEKHDVSKGDLIEFQLRNGSLAKETCRVVQVQSPFRFVVEMVEKTESPSTEEAFIDNINQQAASFRRRKVPQQVSFQPLDVALELAKRQQHPQDDEFAASLSSLFTTCDLDKSFDSDRKRATFSCFQVLESFIETHSRYPTPADYKVFKNRFVDEYWPATGDAEPTKKRLKKHIRNFLHGCAAKFTPFQAVFGAIAAQEVLKAVTGLYFPVSQFLLYDCDEVLDNHLKKDNNNKNDEHKIDTTAAAGLEYILGSKFVKRLQSKNIFLVGAGAIGCEILKNLAPMGVGCGKKKGRVILTDMDSIEKSNLSRQLLFRDGDIGKFKSLAAQEAARRLNPKMKLEAHTSRVGDAEHSPFDAEFWSKRVDIVLNALDNVEARLYIDGQCVMNKKALVDAGTMGPKGNVQVVVPNLSESYASSVDPPEQSIAICTLKNFPYAISHTIQWGRDLFDGLFNKRPEQANAMLDAIPNSSLEERAERLFKERGETSALEAAKDLLEDITAVASLDESDSDACVENALEWAVELALKLFVQAPKELLSEHPYDSVDEDGEPFWSGTRRAPKVLWYTEGATGQEQAVNENLIEFAKNAARLRLEALSAPVEISFDEMTIREYLVKAMVDDGDTSNDCETEDLDAGMQIREHLGKVPETNTRLTPAEFEKDDDSNGHVAFITAASNLRAIAYGIPPVDTAETRRVAGNIIPAMITTTALVSGLSCIELIKLVQKAPLQSYRNAFINLALPFFAFTSPLPAEELPGLRGKKYTLWDRLTIEEGKNAAVSGGISLRSLLEKIKQLASDDPDMVGVPSISYGPYLLYASFLHEDDLEVLDSTVWSLIQSAVESGEEFEADYSRDGEEASSFCSLPDAVDLTVVVEDFEDGTEVELPPIRIRRQNSEADN